MARNKSILYIFIASLAMFILILDAETALSGAAAGIELCITVVIPSLFPFFILTITLTGLLSGHSISIFRPLGKLLHLSEHGQTILFIGLLGGYPVGAQCVAQAYKSGCISRTEAEKMLAFCSNAGPAFIFGIGAHVLGEPWMCWMVWAIHIASAVMTGLLSPASKSEVTRASPEQHHVSFTDSVNRSIVIMSSVCAWIIIFRIILSFLQRWILWLLPKNVSILVSGLLELANGCYSLGNISSMGLRFVILSIMLGFGGVCVALQTGSVLADSGLTGKEYLPGKVVQASISFLLCSIILPFLPGEIQCTPNIIAVFLAMGICVVYIFRKIKMKKEYSILSPAVV